MHRFLIILAFSLFAVTAQAACKGKDLRLGFTTQQHRYFASQLSRVPFAEGMHWVAQKGDRKIHVVGTMHDGDARLNRMMRSVAPYVRAADLVVLEGHFRNISKDFAKLLEDESKHHLVLLQRPPYLDQLLPSDIWTNASLRARKAGISQDIARRLQPMFASAVIGTNSCDPFSWQRKKKGFDAKIESLAHRRGIPVMGLETLEQGLKIVNSIPLRNQVKLIELQYRSKTGPDMATTLRNTYFEEKIALGLAIGDQFFYRDVGVPQKEIARLMAVEFDYLLDRRNKNWIPLLLRREEKNILVAVGAAHLPGRNGLLNLLKARGYKLTRIPMQ